MKNIFILLLSLIVNFTAIGQVFNPIKWKTSVEKVSDSKYKLITEATIEKGWSLYSQEVPKGGPIPTTFTYDDNGGTVKILGNTKEPKGEIKFTKLFSDEGMNIKSFAHKAIFEQEIELVDTKMKEIIAFVEFIACTDEQCLPPKEIDLVFDLSKSILKKETTNKVVN